MRKASPRTVRSTPIRATRTGNARFAVLPDLHAPFTEPAVWEWLIDSLVAERGKLTHLIQVGDWIDTDPASTHPSNHQHTQDNEYAEAVRQSRDLRKAVGKHCKLIRLLGNHEDRLEPDSLTTTVPKRLRDMTHWTRHPDLHDEWRRWDARPYIKGGRGSYSLGQLLVYHGWRCGSNSDEIEACEMNYSTGGWAHRLMVRGHTHAPIPPTQAMKTRGTPLPLHYANVGHAGPSQPRYAYRMNVSMWGPGLLIGSCKTGNPAMMGGRNWEAELRRPR